MWWVDPGQTPDILTQLLPHSPPQWNMRENKMKKLVGQRTDRENTCQLPHGKNRFNFRKMILTDYQDVTIQYQDGSKQMQKSPKTSSP